MREKLVKLKYQFYIPLRLEREFSQYYLWFYPHSLLFDKIFQL